MNVRFYYRYSNVMEESYPCLDSEHRDFDGTYLMNIASTDMRRSDRRAEIEQCLSAGSGYVWGNSACLLFSEEDVRIGAYLDACSEDGNHVRFTREQFDNFYADWLHFLTGVPEFERAY